MTPSILITIDVEDWFQVENFKRYIPFSSWPQKELRVEKNVHRLLDLFDSIKAANNPATSNQQPATSSKNSRKATFFVLGWLAERLPNLVREIQTRGHEVASHGFNHNLCTEESSDRLRQDLLDSKNLLEDIIGAPVVGYRAPNFSISDEILKVIEDCGYLYDSSYNSFAMHGRYGQISFNGSDRKGIAHRITKNFFELPISNLTLQNPLSYARSVRFFEKDSDAYLTGEVSAMGSGRNYRKGFVIPWGGGAYFRLIPFQIFKRGVESILKKENTYLFYMHPWEIDPDQPRVGKASSSSKFRHYINLNRTFLKLISLIKSFDQCRFVTCRQYLK